MGWQARTSKRRQKEDGDTEPVEPVVYVVHEGCGNNDETHDLDIGSNLLDSATGTSDGVGANGNDGIERSSQRNSGGGAGYREREGGGDFGEVEGGYVVAEGQR